MCACVCVCVYYVFLARVGNGAGSIGSWQGCRLVRETPAHAPGPLERRPDGIESPGGVRCLLLQSNNVLLTGGADGWVWA